MSDLGRLLDICGPSHLVDWVVQVGQVRPNQLDLDLVDSRAPVVRPGIVYHRR
jgi:hypothetical protein